MKILVIAIAFDSHGASESSVGWKAVQALCVNHQVHVLCHARNRDTLSAVASSDFPDNLTISYVGEVRPYHPNMFIAKLHSWTEYGKWLDDALCIARDLLKHEAYDLVHHVTYATWRVGSPFWQLGLPFVWGPVGGGGRMPWRLFSILQWKTAFFEAARNIAQELGKLTPSVRKCVQNSTAVVATDSETRRLLERTARRPLKTVYVTPVTYFSDAERRRFAPENKDFSGHLRLVAGGGIIGSKGYMVAFMALREARRKGLQFTYDIAGYGQEKPFLVAQVRKLGLADVVTFHDFLSGEDYRRFLQNAHIFLLPTFREAFCITLAEAMVAGAVPIVADASAPGEIVNANCGFKIPVTTPTQMAGEIVNTLFALDKDRGMLAAKSREARQRIATDYSQQGYLDSIEKIYQSAVAEDVK